MTPSPDRDEQLEQLVHRTLRDLPARRAPRSLEQRVLVELARRAALPWWRKSFAHWPIAARAGFIVLCTGTAKLMLMAAVWVMAGFDAAQYREAFAPQFAWMERGFAVVHALGNAFEIVSRNIPALWVYAALGFLGLMYVALFGLGAAAYKTLYARR